MRSHCLATRLMHRGNLSCCATKGNDLEFRSARSRRRNNSVVGCQLAVWNLRSEDPVWACLRRPGSGHRVDGGDGDLGNARLCWWRLELRKCYSGRLKSRHWSCGSRATYEARGFSFCGFSSGASLRGKDRFVGYPLARDIRVKKDRIDQFLTP